MGPIARLLLAPKALQNNVADDSKTPETYKKERRVTFSINDLQTLHV
jgi:hypothetical protein